MDQINVHSKPETITVIWCIKYNHLHYSSYYINHKCLKWATFWMKFGLRLWVKTGSLNLKSNTELEHFLAPKNINQLMQISDFFKWKPKRYNPSTATQYCCGDMKSRRFVLHLWECGRSSSFMRSCVFLSEAVWGQTGSWSFQTFLIKLMHLPCYAANNSVTAENQILDECFRTTGQIMCKGHINYWCGHVVSIILTHWHTEPRWKRSFLQITNNVINIIYSPILLINVHKLLHLLPEIHFELQIKFCFGNLACLL